MNRLLKDRDMTSSLWKTFSVHILLVLMGILLYSKTLEAPFCFDDERRIEENPHVRITDLSFSSLKKAAFNEYSSKSRPVGNISFALNYCVHQYDLKGYHIVNIAIHILTGIFLFYLFKITLSLPSIRSERADPFTVGAISAVLWIVHPIHTQSVTYIVQRYTILATMFYVLSLFFYVKGRLEKKTARRILWYGALLVAWTLSLGCKEISAMLPFFILLYEYYFFQDLKSSWIKQHYKALMATGFLFLLISLLFLGKNPIAHLNSINDYARGEFTFGERVMTQFRVVLYYLSLIVYPNPSRLNLDYDFPLSSSLIDPVTTLFSFFVIAGLIGFAVFSARKERLISFCIFWFLGNLIIESTVIPLAIIFEHRTYLPSMFVCLLAVFLMKRIIKPKWGMTAIICMVMSFFTFWTYERNMVWGSRVFLWGDCVNKSPGKARLRNYLGNALDEQGRTEEAIVQYLEALRIKPDYEKAHYNLGNVLDRKGLTDKAIKHYLQALRIKPDYEKAYCNLGAVFDRQGRTSEAIVHYLQALRINPDYEEAHNNLGVVFDRQGRTSEAIVQYLEALRIKPDFGEAHCNLGAALYRQGRTSEAIVHYLQALRIKPEYAQAHNNLAIALIHEGNIEKAIVHFREALRINPDYAQAKSYLTGLLSIQPKE